MTIDRRASFQADQLAPAAAPLNEASAKARTKAVLRDVSDVGQRKRDGHESLPLHRFSSRDAFIVVHPAFALCLCSSAVELSIAPSSWFQITHTKKKKQEKHNLNTSLGAQLAS